MKMKKMRYCFFLILLTLTYICMPAVGHAQETDTAEGEKPIILYNGTPKKYEIADIKVEGVKNYEDYVLIGISGLAVGQTITVPGDENCASVRVSPISISMALRKASVKTCKKS